MLARHLASLGGEVSAEFAISTWARVGFKTIKLGVFLLIGQGRGPQEPERSVHEASYGGAH